MSWAEAGALGAHDIAALVEYARATDDTPEAPVRQVAGGAGWEQHPSGVPGLQRRRT